jgi:hypothetical protein
MQISDPKVDCWNDEQTAGVVEIDAELSLAITGHFMGIGGRIPPLLGAFA